MCDYDYDWKHITDRWVARTRKPHTCASCDRVIPAGSRALVITGKSEGEIGTHFGCESCVWCADQPDHTPLHICWGDMMGFYDFDDGPKVHAYVRHCLENGETPTVTGLEGALAQHRELEALEL